MHQHIDKHTHTHQHADRWRGFKRLVGNRAQIFLENAVTMYYMSTYYLQYCDYVLRQVKEGNSLHRRLDEKLRCSEMVAGLRARAIAFIHIQQPLRVATKSNKYGGGKPPTQAHMLKIWQRLMDVANEMERNPEFLLDADFFVFDAVSESITSSCKRYRKSKVSMNLKKCMCVCMSGEGSHLYCTNDTTHPD